jgi:hypothetical protein
MTQQPSLLIVFGMTFTTVGMTIGDVDSYGVLSWIFLGLGIVLPVGAAVLAARHDDALTSDEQNT